MIIEELHKRYDGRNIKEIEQVCSKFSASSAKNRKEFILGLYYLETTKRWRENPVYKASSFETYIRNSFNLRHTTYNKERFVFIAHPDAAVKWGVGLVAKVQRECGAGKVPEVIRQIDAIKNPNHVAIEKIIVKNSKESPPKSRSKKDNDLSKRELEFDNIRKGKTIADYIKTITEQDQQIDTLKKNLMMMKKENAEHIQTIADLRKQLNQKQAIFVPPTDDFFSEPAYYEQTA